MFEQVSLDLGGRKLTLETGKMARQAHGAIVARYGDTVVLATACMDNKATEKDFLPLTVDYREYTYAAGKIPGGFFKREGRPSEREILTSRLTDRPLRPLFPEGWATETQIIAMVLSADSENDPDVMAVTAASAALYISKIPFNNPIACVRVGMLEGKLVVNPTIAEQKTSQMNMIIAGSADAIVMVESGSLEVSEDTVADALEFGHEEIRKIVAAIRELGSRVNQKKVAVKPPAFDEALYKQMAQKYTATGCATRSTPRSIRSSKATVWSTRSRPRFLAAVREDDEEKHKLAYRAFERLRERIFRDDMLIRRRRPDGRAFDQVRQITCEVGVLPRAHGSALFTRGETQALATTTLGTKEDKQRLDLLFEQDVFKRFMLHYNFPPFSVGEVKFLRGAGRREIGHGALAERALAQPAAFGSGFSVRHASGVRHHGIERVVVDGHRVRRIACVDGCGRAAEGSLRRNRDGSGGGGRQIRHPHRHRRRRRSLRRYGLQGCRDAAGNHRAANGYQGRGRQREHDARGAGPGAKSAS